jgi:hypothetical protein
MAELSVLRALNEVSLLNKKIEKENQRGGLFLSLTIGGKVPTGFKTLDEVKKDITGRYQKITDLISRRRNIKAAIVASNAITKITINGVEMTVAAAIEHKSSIAFSKQLLSNLTNSSAAINRKVEQHNDRVESQALQLVETTFGSKNSKVSAEEHSSIVDPFKKSRIAEIIDPLNIKDEIDKKEEEINIFEREIDSILTESNATTMIEVPAN